MCSENESWFGYFLHINSFNLSVVIVKLSEKMLFGVNYFTRHQQHIRQHLYPLLSRGNLQLSSLQTQGQSKDNLLVLWSLTLNTVLIPSAANVMAAWQRGLCFRGLHLLQKQINDFYLSSAAKEEVIDTIHKWCQGFVSEAYEWQKHPPPPSKKTPSLLAKKIESPNTLLIFSPHTFF